MTEAPSEPAPDRQYHVCRVEELPPGAMTVVPIGRFGVGVYNIDGEYYALTNFCPHQGAPLCKGPVQGTTQWQPETRVKFKRVLDGLVVRCPWHGWEFDIRTGKTLSDPARGIRTYAVEVVDGEVVVTP